MKTPICHVLLLLFPLLSLSFYVAEPSPFNITVDSPPSTPFNITRGSSLSASPNQISYWLSPSGIFAFGFYSLCHETSRYKVGIWITDTGRTPVWSAKSNSYEPIYDGSSLRLNHKGVFMLQRLGFKEEPLFSNEMERASYALMHDNDNFIIYNPNSLVIWQSFDYPTNTILSGQTLKTGKKLVFNYEVVMQENGNLVMYNEYDLYRWQS
ncbi:hypothetical protein IFM89_001302 [Coptis chinensis]|uniref:Bulb-type lectin domain-containing protein n=1 Tax=Coptis chinensis TaxID=261450 RepID=A0A835IVE3_9MAGN|nr:hypothetical protein IFM89_001302 [Coptis chinensis]